MNMWNPHRGLLGDSSIRILESMLVAKYVVSNFCLYKKLSFDVLDNEANYEVIGKYQGQNERHANVAVQINAGLCAGKCLGTKTADLYEGSIRDSRPTWSEDHLGASFL